MPENTPCELSSIPKKFGGVGASERGVVSSCEFRTPQEQASGLRHGSQSISASGWWRFALPPKLHPFTCGRAGFDPCNFVRVGDGVVSASGDESAVRPPSGEGAFEKGTSFTGKILWTRGGGTERTPAGLAAAVQRASLVWNYFSECPLALDSAQQPERVLP